MSRRRYISTEISIDKKVNNLAKENGDFAALLYTWMVPHAEDNCEITGDPEELLSMVLPARRDKTENDVAMALKAMINFELVIPFSRYGKPMLFFPPDSFYKYQTYISKVNRCYMEKEQRETPKIAEEHKGTAENTVTPSLSPTPTPSLSLSPSVVVVEENAFARIVKFYQNNIGLIKDFTSQEIGTYLDDGLEPDVIIEAMKDSLTKNDPWGYAKSILNSCIDKKLDTLEKYKADKLKFKMNSKRGEKTDGRNSSSSKSAQKYDTSKLIYKGEAGDPNEKLDF